MYVCVYVCVCMYVCNVCMYVCKMVGRHVTPATRNEGGCEFVPRLPRKMARRHARPGRAQTRPKRATHCHECHACHAKRRCMSDCACQIVPRLPRETRVDVSLCHACHAKWRGVTRDQGAPKPDPSAPPTAMSATPATRNEGGCEFVPRLPRETRVDVSLCHACHAKRGWTNSHPPCEFVPRLPRKMARRHARPGRAQTRPKRATHCHECHACHRETKYCMLSFCV